MGWFSLIVKEREAKAASRSPFLNINTHWDYSLHFSCCLYETGNETLDQAEGELQFILPSPYRCLSNQLLTPFSSLKPLENDRGNAQLLLWESKAKGWFGHLGSRLWLGKFISLFGWGKTHTSVQFLKLTLPYVYWISSDSFLFLIFSPSSLQKYPNSRIRALSNSKTQKLHIDSVAKSKGFKNLEVFTGDVKVYEFEPDQFDRILSIEMFEHVSCSIFYPFTYQRTCISSPRFLSLLILNLWLIFPSFANRSLQISDEKLFSSLPKSLKMVET